MGRRQKGSLPIGGVGSGANDPSAGYPDFSSVDWMNNQFQHMLISIANASGINCHSRIRQSVTPSSLSVFCFQAPCGRNGKSSCQETRVLFGAGGYDSRKSLSQGPEFHPFPKAYPQDRLSVFPFHEKLYRVFCRFPTGFWKC